MNKSVLYFTIGLVTGGAAGATATYFITKEKFAIQNEEDMENYAEHWEGKVSKLKDEIKDLKGKLGLIKDPVAKPAEDPEEAVIARNEGVKKYHHDNGLNSKYGDHDVFGANAEKAQEALKEIKEKEKDSKLISDIDEDEFMNQENGYEKQTIDVFLGDDKYMCGIWGYGTDNEDDVDRKWGKDLEDLIGRSHTYDELLSYCKQSDDGIGLAFVRNDEMMIEFELVIHDGREDDKD